MTATGGMRVGCCAGLTDAALVREAGYDYIELPVGTLMSANDEHGFQNVMGEVAKIGIPVEACNVFIPPTYAITGLQVDHTHLWNYADVALRRMGEIGVRVCVFGSGGARRIPDDFDHAEALDQLQAFLAHVEERSAAAGVRVVIEPLNRGESNVFNSVAESDQFNQSRGLAGIGVLADLYHIAVEGESFDGTRDAGDRLWHAHVADADRKPPGEGSGAEYQGFFRTLRAMGYGGTISLEARWLVSASDELTMTSHEHRLDERRRALDFVRREWKASGGA